MHSGAENLGYTVGTRGEAVKPPNKPPPQHLPLPALPPTLPSHVKTCRNLLLLVSAMTEPRFNMQPCNHSSNCTYKVQRACCCNMRRMCLSNSSNNIAFSPIMSQVCWFKEFECPSRWSDKCFHDYCTTMTGKEPELEHMCMPHWLMMAPVY